MTVEQKCLFYSSPKTLFRYQMGLSFTEAFLSGKFLQLMNLAAEKLVALDLLWALGFIIYDIASRYLTSQLFRESRCAVT